MKVTNEVSTGLFNRGGITILRGTIQLPHSKAVNQRVNTVSCDLFPSIISRPFGKIQLKQQQCFDYTVTTHYEESQ
ncbi:Hypothetical predicted protein [Scomber scombrus]|uniref:Uncharacterized protein n=1 Tax=Scomber scombrus TaxID=13677 RepID=A0AAV1PLW0_SCOSC